MKKRTFIRAMCFLVAVLMCAVNMPFSPPKADAAEENDYHSHCGEECSENILCEENKAIDDAMGGTVVTDDALKGENNCVDDATFADDVDNELELVNHVDTDKVDQVTADIQLWSSVQGAVTVNRNQAISQNLDKYLSSELVFTIDYGSFFETERYLNIYDGKLVSTSNKYQSLDYGTVLSQVDELVCDYIVAGERIIYVTGSNSIVSVDYDGQNRVVVFEFEIDGSEKVRSLVADKDIVFCQIGDVIYCVYMPTSEMVYSCYIPNLARWNVLSIDNILYTQWEDESEIVANTLGTVQEDARLETRSFVYNVEEGTTKIFRIVELDDTVEVIPSVPVGPVQGLIRQSISIEGNTVYLENIEDIYYTEIVTSSVIDYSGTYVINNCTVPFASYPVGSFFNDRNGVGCDHHTQTNNCTYTTNSCDCYLYNGRLIPGNAIQCCGFAKMAYDTIFSTSEDAGRSLDYPITTQYDDMRNIFAQLSPGAYVKFVKQENDGTGALHFIVFCDLIMGNTPAEDQIVGYHANWDNRCGVYLSSFSYEYLSTHYSTILGHDAPCPHTNKAYYKSNAGHTYSCTMCGYIFSSDTHVFSYQNISVGKHTATCTVCNYTGEENHQIIYNTTETSHTKKCALCNYGETTVTHDWSYAIVDANLHTRTCDVCDYSSTLPHNATYTSQGAAGHNVYCNECTYIELVGHSLSAASSISGTNHRRSCSVCAYFVDGAHSFAYTNYSGTQHRRTCSTCNYSDYASHNLVEGLWTNVGAAAQCQYKVTYCTSCSYSTTTYNTSHNYSYGGWHNVGQSGCCQRQVVSCMTCGYAYSNSDTTHSYTYGGWSVVGTASTCMKRTVSCSVCRYSYTDYDYTHNYVGVCLKCGRSPY